MIQLQTIMEQSMRMRYYSFLKNNVWSAPWELIQQCEQSIKSTYGNIDNYTPCDWGMYNDGNDSCYNGGHNQGLFKRSDYGWNDAKDSSAKIFEKVPTDAE